MKRIIVIAAAWLFGASCNSQKEIQADLVNVKLVKVETVSRWKSLEKKLTWKCANNLEMVTFVPYNTNMIVGTNYKMLLTK